MPERNKRLKDWTGNCGNTNMTTSGSVDEEGNGSTDNSELYTPQTNLRPASHNNNLTGISMETFRIGNIGARVLTSFLQKIANLKKISI